MTTTKTTTDSTTLILPGGVELVMVAIPGKDYWMGKFPVTQAQWEAVMGENPSFTKGAENPVEKVSWEDCQRFLEKFNAQSVVQASGLVFRLPTGDEWELACRAGATGDYCKLSNGTEITAETLGEVAWFDEESSADTHPVGQKRPNAFGLYDMLGNVCEWTDTVTSGKGYGFIAYRGMEELGIAEEIIEYGDHDFRVARGGNFANQAIDCTSGCLFDYYREDRQLFLGFRLCASARGDADSSMAGFPVRTNQTTKEMHETI